jgi:hypothetical protein
MSRTRGLVTYLLISFGVTWTVEITARLLGYSLADPLVQLLSLGWIVPAAAAIIVRRWVTREGFADAGLALRVRAAWRHYLAAWLGPLAFTAAAVGLAAALGLWQPTLAPLNHLIPGGQGGSAAAGSWSSRTPRPSRAARAGAPRASAGPGRPTTAVRPLAATLATGLIWAIWHYPLPFLGYFEFANLALGLAVWTVSFLCQEIILTWLRLHSGSIWTTSIAHAGNNMTLSFLTGMLLGNTVSVTALTAIGAAPIAAVAAWILLTGRYRAVPTHAAGGVNRLQPSAPDQ